MVQASLQDIIKQLFKRNKFGHIEYVYVTRLKRLQLCKVTYLCLVFQIWKLGIHCVLFMNILFAVRYC